MKKISPLNYVAILLAIGCIALIYLGYPLIAPALGLLASLILGRQAGKESAKWQFYTFIIIASVLGYSLSSTNGYHLLTISMFLLTVAYVLRCPLLEVMGYNKMMWFEPIIYSLAIALYVVGNMKEGIGWPGWIYPLPLIGLVSFRMIGVAIDIKEFIVLAKGKYSARVGSPAPDFTLTDQNGNKVSLSDYRGKQHALIVFVRGDWCPTCHIMLRTYERNKDKFAEKNIVIMAIGPDPAGVNLDMVQRLGIDYKVLSDEKNTAAQAYGMMFQKNNPLTKYDTGIPLPAAFLVDINGTVLYTSNPKTPGEILSPEKIFPVVESLQVA